MPRKVREANRKYTKAGFRVIDYREVIRNKVQIALVTEQEFHAAEKVQVPSQTPLTEP